MQNCNRNQCSNSHIKSSYFICYFPKLFHVSSTIHRTKQLKQDRKGLVFLKMRSITGIHISFVKRTIGTPGHERYLYDESMIKIQKNGMIH